MPTAGSLQEVAREHVAIHSKGKGGNTKFTCNHCKKEYTGSQTRQLAHLTGTSGNGVGACHEIDDDLRNAIKIEVNRLERIRSGSQASSSHISIQYCVNYSVVLWIPTCVMDSAAMQCPLGFFHFLSRTRPKPGAAVRAPGAVPHPHPHPYECN